MYTFYKKHEYLLAILFVLITQLIVLPEVGKYPDTDNYTHARRILDLIESRNWAETPYMHTNYPFGEILHFTRITDVFWLFFSLPAFLFFPVKDAVYWGGYIYQTGILALSAAALIWALKPLAPAILRFIGLCLLFVQPSITETYILNKPDHHVLTAFFAFTLTGSLLHYVDDKQMKYLRIAGISAGLGLWASIEGLLISYALLAGMILLFLIGKESIKACTVYCSYYFFSSFICLIVNPPYEGFFFPDNGRLSFLLVTVISFTTGAMFLLYFCEEKKLLNGFVRKICALTGTAVFFIALLFLFFPPDIIFAPYFPPIIKEIWADDVVELQSVLKKPVLFFLGGWPSILSLLTGIAIFKFCTPKQRSFLILTLFPLIFLVSLSSISIRYSRLSSLFTPFSFVLAFSLRTKKLVLSERKKSILLALLYVCTTIYLGANYISVNRIMASFWPSVSIVKPYLPQGEGSILADTFLGPDIVWTLNEKVIGSPYHRNVEGITDGVLMLHSKNQAVALDLLKKHRVKAILIYFEIPDLPYLFYNMKQQYSFFNTTQKKDTLFLQLLYRKGIPCGISEELNTPPPFILYNVDFSKCSGEQNNEATEKN